MSVRGGVPRRGRLSAVVVAIAALAVAGCGDDEDASTTTDPPASTTTVADTSTTAAADGGTKTTVVASDPTWNVTAAEFRGDDGSTHDLDCTPNPAEEPGSLWGAGTYTDDSSVCTAAVQSGLITYADGGTVTFEIAAGLAEYEGGVANGVTSQRYGAWPGSFVFPDAPPGSVEFEPSTASWQQTATDRRGKDGERVTITCSPGGTAGRLWGSGPYTDDSSLCTAGVHAGVIDLTTGGEVVVEIAPGEASYEGSTANGVTSLPYGRFDGSFVVVTDP